MFKSQRKRRNTKPRTSALNPIKVPDEISLNPRSLNPAARATADADIERRVSLLIDLDPPGPAGTNANRKREACCPRTS